MKQNHTDITIVLDRSGSMTNVATDTIGGFNRFLEDQKKVPGTARITLHQFDDLFETPIRGVDIQKASELTTETFVPRGNTALFDAIGRAVGETGARLSQEAAAKVVFVIITDGHENASKEYDSKRVQTMIEHQRSKYSWQFVFLGANQDAITSAANIGISASNAMTYAANAKGVDALYASASANLRSFRSGQSVGVSFSVQDREEQKKAGA